MHIVIFGALGQVGRRVTAEAVERGHRVTAAVPDARKVDALPAQLDGVVADATDSDAVAAAARSSDLVVSATRPAAGNEHDLVVAAKALLTGSAEAGVRLLLVGGASSLVVPGTGGRTVLEDPNHLHPAGRRIGQACADQLEACRRSAQRGWTYLSPPASLHPGRRTGHYRVGHDELVVDADGRSQISMEDLAVALLDEAERPRHRGRRFTAAY